MPFESVNLSGAIREKLITDTNLMNLLGNEGVGETQDTLYRVAQAWPEAVRKTAFLGYYEDIATPLVFGLRGWRKSRIIFEAVSTRLPKAGLVADRLVHLLDRRDTDGTAEANPAFYDFSNSNIRNRSTIFVQRDSPEFSQDNQGVWIIPIQADLVWLDTPCNGSADSPTIPECDLSSDDTAEGLNCPDD